MNSIASRVAVRRRYVRSVDLARDIDDPDALDGYVVTPSVRDAAVRILAGLSAESRQRAFRVVGPYGAGKSAFGVFLARLVRERGCGPAMALLSEANGGPVEVAPWRPMIISGRRVSFARELLRVVASGCECGSKGPTRSLANLQASAGAMLDHDGVIDARAVADLLAELAARLRSRTGEGLLLLVDEMGRFLEHAAAHHATEDPSIFQALAERSGGRAGADLAIVGFLHHRFADYVAGLGGWLEAEWSRSSERYEELSFGGSTEQSLFMLARALKPSRRHTAAVRRRAEALYGQAADRWLFAVPRADVVEVAPHLYPLHPAAVAALALAIRRFGQNERSLFGFLLSLEPAGLTRFAHSTPYGADHWYLLPSVFDHLAATLGESAGRERARRWSLAFDALTSAAALPPEHRDVLKTVALVAVLEPLPGLAADCAAIAWSLGIGIEDVQPILDELTRRSLIYCRPHRGDYSLWSTSSVDLSRWLDEARTMVRAPERLDEISSRLTAARPAVAHRHYHQAGTLRTFDVALWSGEEHGKRRADGLILVAPVYPGEDRERVLRAAAAAVEGDPVALVCARTVTREDLEWAHELALWSWVKDNCQELKVDELARAEVDERIAAAEQALMRATAVLSSASSVRDETWWRAGERVEIPQEGLSALLSDLCDRAYDRAPTLKNELINRAKLSSAAASARMRLLERMLTCEDQDGLGMEGTPPERTIYLSLFHASGIHREDGHGGLAFRAPDPEHPHRWRPVWDRVTERLDRDEAVSFGELMEDLAAPPYGLRAGPALLLVAAYILALRDNVAVMERNTFQPELSVGHFMRLAKSPGRFALRSLHERANRSGAVQVLATRLEVIGACRPTVAGILEKIYAWYHALPPHALKTSSVSETAVAVRGALRKACEPGQLLFHDLPAACGAVAQSGSFDVERFGESLNAALLEIDEATPSLRLRVEAALSTAFGVGDVAALRRQIEEDYEPFRLYLTEYRLRAFIERALNAAASERWLDGIAGHLTGQRPDNWSDGMLDKFEFEAREVAGHLAKWLALVRTRQAGATDLRSVHVVAIDGDVQVLHVRRDRPSPEIEARLSAVREALGDEPRAMEVLGHLIAEYAEHRTTQTEDVEVGGP